MSRSPSASRTRPPAPPPTFSQGDDLSSAGFIALSAIVHIAFLLALSMLPEQSLRFRRDPATSRARVIDMLRVAQTERPPAPTSPDDPDPEEPRAPTDPLASAGPSFADAPSPSAPTATRSPTDAHTRDPLRNRLARPRPSPAALPAAPLGRDEARRQALLAGAPKLLQTSQHFQELLTPNTVGTQPRVLASNAPGAPGLNVDPFGDTPLADGGFTGTPSVGGPPPGGGDGPLPPGLVARPTGGRAPAFKDRAPQPTVGPGPITVAGKLDRETVRGIIRRNLSGLRACYQDALQGRPDLSGTVTLDFQILPNGLVTGAAATRATFADPTLVACIVAKIGRLRFPSPPDGGVVRVTYPVILKSR